MKLEEYAKQELDILCPPDENGHKDEMQEAIEKDILDIVRLFARQGHSGMSASYMLSILGRILHWYPITPLTGEEDEWLEPTMNAMDDMQQNKRCHSVFRYNHDNATAVNIEGRIFSNDGGEIWYTTKESRVPVTFPYTVPAFPEKVYISKENNS